MQSAPFHRFNPLLVLVQVAVNRRALGEPGDHVPLVETSYLPQVRAFGRPWPLGTTRS